MENYLGSFSGSQMDNVFSIIIDSGIVTDEVAYLAGISVGIAVATKVVVLDSNKDYSGIRYLSIERLNLSEGVTFTILSSKPVVKPVSGRYELYMKSSGLFYMDSTGTEAQIGAGVGTSILEYNDSGLVTYQVGNFCYYDYVIYICITATGGVFNTNHWQEFKGNSAQINYAGGSYTNVKEALDGKADITYVTGLIEGLSWKDTVVAATTGKITILTDLNNGDIIDDVVLVTGDRVLVKNQGDPYAGSYDNGIWIVGSVPVRADDMEISSDFNNAIVPVAEGGTINGGTNWRCTNVDPLVETSDIVFTPFADSTPEASVITKGKIKLAGDLTGTADLPRIAYGLPAAKITASPFQVVDFYDPLVCDAVLYKDFICELITRDTTLDLTNTVNGDSGMIEFIIDGTGGYTITLGAMFTKKMGSGSILNTPNADNVISWRRVVDNIVYTIAQIE